MLVVNLGEFSKAKVIKHTKERKTEGVANPGTYFTKTGQRP